MPGGRGMLYCVARSGSLARTVGSESAPSICEKPDRKKSIVLVKNECPETSSTRRSSDWEGGFENYCRTVVGEELVLLIEDVDVSSRGTVRKNPEKLLGHLGSFSGPSDFVSLVSRIAQPQVPNRV